MDLAANDRLLTTTRSVRKRLDRPAQRIPAAQRTYYNGWGMPGA